MYGNVKRDERRRIRKSGQRQVTAQETDNIKRRKSFFFIRMAWTYRENQ